MIRVPLLAALAAAAVGCDPHLPVVTGDVLARLDGGGGSGGEASGGGGLVVSVEPSAPASDAPRVLRLHASLGGFTFDPTRMALVEGSLGPRQLEELTTGKVSAALSKRIVPSLTWADSAGEVLAPTAPLAVSAAYTLALADIPTAVDVTVATADAVPLLPRVWPPAGGSGTAALAVWCGGSGDAVPPVDTPATMAPAGLSGHLRKGVVVGGAGGQCLRFEADPASLAGVDGGVPAAVPPPMVTSSSDPSPALRLDPRPLQVDATPTPLVPPTCTPDEVLFGPACVQVADDRLYGRSPGAPLLWAVAGAGTDTVMTTGPGDPFVITGLPPSTNIVLDVAAIDAGGTVARAPFLATTLPPEPHVVINEVLAWPLGASPDQEWVEILNDGPAPASLDGYVLVVGSGSTALPVATLAPGAFALVVAESYTPGGPDVAPAPGTLLLSVPHLGKKGISHEGVALALIDGGGNTVSSFPAAPKPKQGSSVARRVPSAPDALPSSFARAAPTPGWTNAW
jgi:hypothetical protein